MKNITIAGGIGRDAELRTTQNGDKVAGFSVAVDDGVGQNKGTIWFDVSIWGKRAEALAQYLTKGSRVAVSGDLGRREHNGTTYLTVRADQVTLLGGGQAGNNRDRSESGLSGGSAGGQGGGMPSQIDDSDIPFAACWWA